MDIRAPLLPRWFRWSAVLIVAGVIFYASILTVPPETPVDRLRFQLIPLDKWRHFLAYAAFAGALAYATVDLDATKRWTTVLVIGVAVLYGVGIEIGQSFLPARYFSLVDAYANALGALLIAPWYAVRSSVRFVGLREWLRSAVSAGE